MRLSQQDHFSSTFSTSGSNRLYRNLNSWIWLCRQCFTDRSFCITEFVPGPKGRNTGIYYTFMGAASYLMPVIVAKLTVISGESKAVYTLMTLMFILAVVQVVATLYLILRYKKVFGTTPLAKAE